MVFGSNIPPAIIVFWKSLKSAIISSELFPSKGTEARVSKGLSVKGENILTLKLKLTLFFWVWV